MELASGMIKVNSSGLNEVVKMFEGLTNETEGTMKQCVYKGAGEVADTMKSRVEALKTQSDNKRTDVRFPYTYEKEALIENLGIAPIQGGEVTNTKVGFDGYYTNKRGQQKPVPLLANSINAGTSFMKKQGFINATKRAAQNPCIDAMQKQLDKVINQLTKGE